MKYNIPSPLEKVNFFNHPAYIKRDDIIHPFVSGNKWRKLKHFLLPLADKKDEINIVTCGGPWSNHLLATASICRDLGYRSVGLVRGDYYPEVNPLLKKTIELGMDIRFLSNDVYDRLQTDPQAILSQLGLEQSTYVPMGGAGPAGMRGCQEIVHELLVADVQPDRLVLAVGTGTTALGVIAAINWPCEVLLFSALSSSKEVNQFKKMISQVKTVATYTFLPFHACPFGKVDKQLVDFIRAFFDQTGILLDPMYNGKMMAMYSHWLASEAATMTTNPSGTTVFYHSGGLAGWHGIIHRYARRIDLTFLDRTGLWPSLPL